MIKITQHWSRCLVAILTLLLLGTLAWQFWLQPATVSTPTSYWLRVEPQLLENHLGLTGRLQAATRMTLTAPFDGIVKEVSAVEGERVEAGQPLLTLDTGLLDIQLRQALSELIKAQRTVQALRDWDQSQEVTRARRTLNNARMTLVNTEASLKDTRTLFERGIIARMEVDALEQQARAQRQDLSAAQLELQAILDKGRGEERQIADMALANVQAHHQALQLMQAQQVVRAPFAGVLVRPAVAESGKWQPIQPGIRLAQGMPLFGLIDPDRLQAVASIEEADLHQLGEAMPVEIEGDGFVGVTLHGHIQTIAIEGRSTESQGAGARYDVLVAIEQLTQEQHQRLRLGMSARLSIVTYRNEQGIAVPAEALRTDENGNNYVIFRSNAASASQRLNVTLGMVVPQGIEVKGMPAGDIEINLND